MQKKEIFSPFWKQCFVTAAVGINIVGHGCAIGYPAVLLPQLFKSDAEITLDHSSASWIASVLGITQLVGSFITPPIMDRWGRRAAHLAVTMPVLVGWFMIALAESFQVRIPTLFMEFTETLFIGRILQGLSIGMLSPLRSILIGEYSSPKYRGAFLTTVSLTQTFGIFFVHLIGSFLSWQQTALISVFFSFASLVMTLYSPESPSWLLSKGRYEDCREVFRWLRGHDEEEELEEMIEAREKFEEARQTIHSTKQNRLKSMAATIRKKEFFKPIVIMIHAYLMVQAAGGTTMSAYSTTVISIVLGPDANAYYWMIILDSQRLITNCIAVFVINYIKRRTMLFMIGSLCLISQLALAGYTYAKAYDLLQYDALWLPAVLINLQFFTISAGMLPLPNVIGGEVFPLEYKSIGGSISLATTSVSFFIVLKTFIYLVDNIGIYGTYLLYSCLLSYCLVVIWFMLPETKGKTLQQIEDEFRGRPLTFVELQSRMSLHTCPVKTYKRKISRKESALILN